MAKPRYNPTNEKIIELAADLEAEKVEHKRTARQLKEALKQSAIFKALRAELQEVVKPLTNLPSAKEKAGGKPALYEEDLVLHLSDSHADEVVRAESVGGLEEYNFEIALARAERLVDKVISISQTTMTNYRFKTLWILFNGDLSSGEIHGGVTRSAFQNQFKNCFAISQMFSLMFRDLAPYFQHIKIICTSGNHGRRSIKKDYNQPMDNWDYMIYESTRLLCKDIKNIEFLIPNSFSVNINIRGHAFHIEHGDEINSWNNIPWYGIERKTRRLVALYHSQNIKARYFCFGHFHQPTVMSHLNGETIINGAWLATTPYVFEKLSSYNEPSQILHGVGERGITFRFKIDLKIKGERSKRYQQCFE